MIKALGGFTLEEDKVTNSWAYFIKYGVGFLALLAVLYFLAKYIIPIIWSLIR